MAYRRIGVPPQSVRLVRDQNQIRQELLRKLGVAGEKESYGKRNQAIASQYQQDQRGQFSIRRAKKNVDEHDPTIQCVERSMIAEVSYSQPLKYQADEEWSDRCPKVRFRNTVLVQLIPSHHDYDETTRQSLWTGPDEIKENARRNRIEFMADNFSWKRAAEEKDMYDWNGELVHPATYWMRYQEQQEREFLAEIQPALRTNSSSVERANGMMNSRCISAIKRSPTMTSLQVY